MRKGKAMQKLNEYLFVFDEGYGTAYERYALNRFIAQLVHKYGILKILEMPANGVMGIPGINSLGFAELGCEVTVAHPSKAFLENANRIWDALGLDAHFVKSHWINSEFDDNSFDLVWNFCVYGHFKDPKRVIQEMVRVTRRYICIQFQNIANPGFFIHRLHHRLQKEPWNHGEPGKMNISAVMNIASEAGSKIVEIGGIDMPPWPDIPLNLKETIHWKRNSSGLKRAVNTGYNTELGLQGVLTEWNETIRNTRGFEKVSGKKERILRLFTIWYDSIEKKAPLWVKTVYAHHFSILAEKIR